MFGSLIKHLSQVPVMQPYNSSQARQERGNRAYLASQARPMQRSAHMLWLKGNMHTKRSKRGQPNTGLEEPLCADAYNQSNVCCMQLAWWGRAWFVDAGRLGNGIQCSHSNDCNFSSHWTDGVQIPSNVYKKSRPQPPSLSYSSSFLAWIWLLPSVLFIPCLFFLTEHSDCSYN